MRYFIRSVKFLIALFVIYLAAVWIMIEAGASMLTMRETLQVLVHTTRGIVLLVAIVAWAAIYPRVGFVSRRVEGDMTDDREKIIRAFISAGYVLKSEDGEQMHFRAAGLFHKLRLLFEDEITVSQYGQWIVLDGIRRSVADVQMRLKTGLNSRDDEEQKK